MALPREAYVRVHSSPAERADSQLRIELNRGPTNPERLHLQLTHSSPPTPSQGPISSSASIYTKSLRQGSAIGKDQASSGSRRKGENTASLSLAIQARRKRHLITSPLVRLFVPSDRHLSFVHSDLSRSVFKRYLYTDVSLGGVHPESTDPHRRTDTPDRQIDSQPHTHTLSQYTPPLPCRPS